MNSLIDNVEDAFCNSLKNSNLYIIQVMLDYSMINTKQVEKILLNNCNYINNEKIADFILRYGLNLGIDVINNILKLYIINKWSPDTIMALINSGGKIYKNDTQAMAYLPDKIFHNCYYTHIVDSITLNRDIITALIIKGCSIKKIKLLCNELILEQEDYYYICSSSFLQFKIFKYFFSQLNDKILKYKLLLGCGGWYYTDENIKYVLENIKSPDFIYMLIIYKRFINYESLFIIINSYCKNNDINIHLWEENNKKKFYELPIVKYSCINIPNYLFELVEEYEQIIDV